MYLAYYNLFDNCETYNIYRLSCKKILPLFKVYFRKWFIKILFKVERNCLNIERNYLV